MTTELVVDLRGTRIETIDDFWDAVSGPCELPSWFGRNVDAWRDTIQARGISNLIDRHDTLVVHVDGTTGFFSRKGREVRDLRSTFAGRRSRLVVHHSAKAAGGA
ncbi:barstar family protein [Actinoplanes sp. NPDC023801]|uniref:barstar family protein n=1 Tax=Actinoplanes sp. NPDC023801 TaxID=3154595 RepID=UPI0033F49D14